MKSPRRHRSGSTSAPGLLAGCLLCAGLPAAQAATTSWIASGGGSWETAANWSAGVPGPLDVAVVTPTLRPDAGIVINTATTVAGLSLARLNMQVRADLTVTGAVSWLEDPGVLAGVMIFANAPTLRFQGSVGLTGNGTRGWNNTGVLEFAGPTTWSGNGAAGGNSLTVGVNSSNTVIRNLGVFTDGNSFDTALSGRGTFDNQGNLAKTGASLTRVDIASFINSGSVAVAAGTLLLPGVSGVQTGSWQISAGATLDFAGGTPTLLGTLGGSGTLRLSGGTVTIEGSGRNVPTLLDGATLAGTYQVLDGPLTWRSGAFGGTGTTVLTGAVTLEGDAAKVIGEGRQLQSYGTTTWSGGALNIGAGPQGLSTGFANLGEFRDGAGGSRRVQGVGQEISSFVNAGTYLKTGSGITTFSALAFDNIGVIDARAGLMRFQAPVSNSGLIRAAAGAGVLVAAAAPLDNQGTLTGDGGIDAVAGIVNRGLISPGDAIGTLTLGNLRLAPEGRLKIELGAGGANDLLALTGMVDFGGTLELWNAGATLLAGDSFTVMQFASREGTSSFADIQFYGFAPEVRLDLSYGASELRVFVVGDPSPLPAVPEPGTWALWLAGLAAVALRAGRALPRQGGR